MNIEEFITDWLEASNSYDTNTYLEKYLEEATLNDPSVGKKFIGHKGIKEYYETYFIGYKTQTRLLNLSTGDSSAHLEVDFTGDFPGGQIGGVFHLKFKNGKILEAEADLT